MRSNERLVYVDDGINELVIRYQDLPDFIVNYNRDIKVYEYEPISNTPLLSTCGMFLNKCNKKVRNDIIDRLTYLQLGGKIRKFKVIYGDDLEMAQKEFEIKI